MKIVCIGAVAAAFVSSTASATTILDLEGGTAGTELDGTATYTEDGYLLEYWAGDNPVFVDTGGNIALGDSVQGTGGLIIAAGLQISRVDGQPFDLLAFDVANLGTAPGDLSSMSIAAGGTTLQFSPAIGAGFVTETITDPAFSNITTLNVSLVAESAGQFGSDIYVVDNFQVIPTPGAAGLLAVAGFAAARRRR